MTDWVAFAEEITPDPRPDWYWEQHQLALQYLTDRIDGGGAHDLTAVTRRAAVILLAEPGDPQMEQYDGIRFDASVEGQAVKCRNSACRRKWIALPEDPYFDGTGRADGLCVACVLLETRSDDAVPVIEATAITAPRRRKNLPGPVDGRQTRNGDTDRAGESGGDA